MCAAQQKIFARDCGADTLTSRPWPTSPILMDRVMREEATAPWAYFNRSALESSVGNQHIELLTEFPEGSLVNKIRIFIERCRLTVNDRKQGAVALRDQRE